MVDRNPDKAWRLQGELQIAFPDADIRRVTADLEHIDAVENACRELETCGIDILIHNAGAYSIPRRTCSTGFDNVFQINFVSPYYITNRLLPHLSARHGRVVAVGSIAHNYAKTDADDVDFATRRKASLVYGNAKRYLMFSLFELLKDHPDVTLAVTHPGITLTNITAHYPKWLFALIKHPMKWIFMPPKAAALSIVEGLFEETPCYRWIGPKWWDVWGEPVNKALTTCLPDECRQIDHTAKQIYAALAPAFSTE